MGITGSTDHLEDATLLILIARIGDFEDRDVERSAAQVKDDDFLVFTLVQTVSKCCCGRLIDDTSHFESSDLTSILRGLTLCVVEICRNRDDGFVDLVAEVRLSRFLELSKHLSRDFLRRMLLVAHLDFHVLIRRAGDSVGNHFFLGLNFVMSTPHETLC